MLAQAIEIVPLRSGRADQQETLGRQPRDREFAEDPAPGVERPRQRDAALAGQAAADEAVEPGFGAGALHDQLGEAAEVENADALAHRPAFLADGVEEAGLGATKARPGFWRIAGAREIGRALPAAARAEERAFGFEPVVERRRLGGAAGGALFQRIYDGVFVLVEFDRLGDDIGFGRIIGVTPRIEAPKIPFGLTVDDPFRQRLAGATGLRDAEREAAALEEIRQSVRWADIGVAVGRIGDRAVDDTLHADLPQDRHARDCRLDIALEPVEVVGIELMREIVGD